MDTSPEFSHEPSADISSLEQEVSVEMQETVVQDVAEATPEQEAEQARLRQLEQLEVRSDQDEVHAAAEADVAQTLQEMTLDEDRHTELGKMLNAIRVAAHEVTQEHEGEYRALIEHVLTERYKMTLAELLGAFKPTKMEYLSPGGALAAEAAIWATAKAFNVEPADLSLQKKAEYRWKAGGDIFKLLGLMAKVIPQARAYAMPLEKLGVVTENMGQAMEKINANPNATAWDASKELTMAMIPRAEDGSVDMQATLGMISQAGGLLEQGGADAGISHEVLTQVSTWLKEHPEKLVAGVQRVDQLVRGHDQAQSTEG